jgi:plastocyanin
VVLGSISARHTTPNTDPDEELTSMRATRADKDRPMAVKNRVKAGIVRNCARLVMCGATISAFGAAHPYDGVTARGEGEAAVAVAAARVNSAPAADTISATLSEWAITASRATVATGPVVIRVTNSGTMAHRLEVEGKGLEKRTNPIAPGEHVDLTVKLVSGEYELYCPLGSGAHKKMGMKTAISVAARPKSEG